MEIKALSLFELNQNIKNVIKASFDTPTWIIAEISDIKENRNGHCYLELVEKDPAGNQIKARSRAIIWAYTYRMLKPYFETTTGQLLQSGIKVMVSVMVEFHEQYGFSLEIKDIEPSFTIGEIEKQKQEILEKLLAEGVLDMNKELPLTPCPQKLAIISSPTAAGYMDFMNQLNNNPFGYMFYTKLFPSVMQGAETEASMSVAFEKIYAHEDFFDAVIVIRGGGASIDLNCFNNYNLAYLVTQFPLPVITGIGHEKDETILDIVANQKLKTPTAVAEFLIDKLSSFEYHLDELNQRLVDHCKDHLNNARNTLAIAGHNLSTLASKKLAAEELKLERTINKIPVATNKFFEKNKTALQKQLHVISRSIPVQLKKHHDDLLKAETSFKLNVSNYLKNKQVNLIHQEESLKHLNPNNILKRGFSITLKNGKALLSAKSVKKDDKIETLLYQGRVKSTVILSDPKNE